MKRSAVLILLVLLWTASTALAAGSPVGKWTTIDDKTKKEKSIVELYEQNGKIYGKILDLLLPEDKGKVCDKCTGADKDKPTLGLVIVKDMKADGDVYKGGTILDPKNGKVYSCKMEVIEGGNKLEVRGFLGISLLGRTQTWIRVK